MSIVSVPTDPLFLYLLVLYHSLEQKVKITFTKNNILGWYYKMFPGIKIPLSLWNTIIGVMLTAIIALVSTSHSAYITTRDTVLLTEHRSLHNTAEVKEIRADVNDIKARMTKNLVALERIQYDQQQILGILLKNKDN